MSKLLKRSKSNLDTVRYKLTRQSEDDSALDTACFSAHQALEFALKFAYECHGFKYPWGHDIAVLIEGLLESGVDWAVLTTLQEKASMYTSWETDSRYDDDFYGTAREINQFLILMDQLYACIDIKMYHSEVPDDVYRWCMDNAPDAVKSLPTHEMLDMMLPLYDAYKQSEST